jgi:hypothetical protein
MLIFIFNPIIVLILHFKYKVLFDDYIHLNLSSTKILAVWFKIFKVLSKRKYIIVETFHTNWILLNRKDRIINRIAWIFIDIIICELGDDERDILKKIMPKKDIRFIPFAIRIDNKISYEKREFEFEKNEILIISIARIVNRIKRFDISLKAVSLLENKYKYIIAGDGQDKKLIEKYINKLGLSDRAIIIGYVDNPIKYINMSNIVIAAMIGSYPGLAGLQAGISGKALIGIQINKDYYGEKDIIWSSNDPHKIALKIQSLENTAEYEKYTRNVKDFLLERHSLENFHREYNNIFLGLQ